jgi:hypothetical protein
MLVEDLICKFIRWLYLRGVKDGMGMIKEVKHYLKHDDIHEKVKADIELVEK